MLFPALLTIFAPIVRHFIKKVEGLDNLPKKAPYIIAINHASFADPIFLTVALYKKLKGDTRKLYFIAKRKLIWGIFTYSLAEKLFNLLIVNPQNKKDVLRKGEEVLNNKNILVIFYEGTRTGDGRLQKGKTGAARLALKLKLPVVPIVIQGTREFWGRGKIIPRYKRNVKVNIGKPLFFHYYLKEKITKNSINKATRAIEYNVKSLLKQK